MPNLCWVHLWCVIVIVVVTAGKVGVASSQSTSKRQDASACQAKRENLTHIVAVLTLFLHQIRQLFFLTVSARSPFWKLFFFPARGWSESSDECAAARHKTVSMGWASTFWHTSESWQGGQPGVGEDGQEVGGDM